jgi:hypothetical protein
MRVLFWASVVAALGGVYAALASLWPILFQRGVVKHGRREASGYRIGLWKVYWRLPTRAAIAVALMSLVPIPVVVLLDGWLVALILTIITSLILTLWMVAPPGMVIGFSQKGQPRGPIMLEPRSHRPPLWTIIRLVIFGLIPALGIGAIVSWVLAKVVV